MQGSKDVRQRRWVPTRLTNTPTTGDGAAPPTARRTVAARRFADSRPWVSFMLYLYVLVQLLVVIGSIFSLLGSRKIPPRLFFGVVVIGLQALMLGFVFLALYARPGEMYFPRVQWEIVTFLVAGVLALISTTLVGACHVVMHGDKASLQPFEVPGDVGTSFLAAHILSFSMAVSMIWIAMTVIYAYTLNIYKLTNVTLT